MEREEIINLIVTLTKSTLSQSGLSEIPAIEFNTPLYSSGGVLDSLGLVQLLADLEEEVYQKTEKQIVIADEKAMSMKISPFRSVSSLADYLSQMLVQK